MTTGSTVVYRGGYWRVDAIHVCPTCGDVRVDLFAPPDDVRTHVPISHVAEVLP